MPRSLKSRIVRLAHSNPVLRAPLLEILERVATGRVDDEFERLLHTPQWWEDREATDRLARLISRRSLSEPQLRQIFKGLHRKIDPAEANQLRSILDWPAIPSYVLTEEQADTIVEAPWLYPHMESWKGYEVTVYYEVWTHEDLDVGDTDDRGEEYEKEAFSLEEAVDLLDSYSWEDWSASTPRSGDWLVSEGQQDYRDGSITYYHGFVQRLDKKDLTREEIQYLSKKLGVRV